VAIDSSGFKNLDVKALRVGDTLTVNGLPVIPGPRVAGGQVQVTGSGAIVSGLDQVTVAVACLAGPASAEDSTVAVTWSGGTLVFEVRTSTIPVIVNWIALGS